MKFVFCFCLIALVYYHPRAQNVSVIIDSNIATAQLYPYGNQQGFPMYILGSSDQLQLEFDDLSGGFKNYYYSYVLCDYNWNPCNLSAFDYIKGFPNNRISTYRNSSIAFTRYTHYEAIFPQQNAYPTKSGNYLLKVFLDGDTSKTVFTKQFIVVDVKSTVSAQVIQPFTPNFFFTHQQIQFSATINGPNTFSLTQQVKAVILQNNRWDNAVRDLQPTFIRGNVLDFMRNDNAVFYAGKEWRWLDITSFRLLSDRVLDATYTATTTDIFVKADVDRSAQRYVFFPDYNGMYNIRTYEQRNPLWQGDYARVHFAFESPRLKENLYLAGAFTNYERNDKWKMKYNDESGRYEISTFLKQGYYNYTFLKGNGTSAYNMKLEGNYWETENSYMILIYYRGFSDRCDQLVGVSRVTSRKDRPGFSF